jgi:hypothetical protein
LGMEFGTKYGNGNINVYSMFMILWTLKLNVSSAAEISSTIRELREKKMLRDSLAELAYQVDWPIALL